MHFVAPPDFHVLYVCAHANVDQSQGCGVGDGGMRTSLQRGAEVAPHLQSMRYELHTLMFQQNSHT